MKTLEESAKEYAKNWGGGEHEQASVFTAFINGAKWQAERNYSEEEVLNLLEDRSFHCCGSTKMSYESTKEWFKNNKK